MTADQIKLWQDIIRTPAVSTASLEGISSRLLNYWESQGALSCSRHSARGWRKFSIADMLFLYISLELRSIGIGLITIAKIKNVIVKKGYLEFVFIKVMEFDQDVFLWIGTDGKISVLSAREIAEMAGVASKLSRVKIVLPLSRWIRKLVEAAK